MATEATRRARPSLSALLAILLALIAGLAVPVAEPAGPAPTAISAAADASRHRTAPAPARTIEPAVAPADALDRTSGVAGFERDLCTQLATAVVAARAPPTATV